MLITCPKCGDTLRKGSWEIFTHCPSCGLEWPVDPDEPRRVKRRITRNAVLWTLTALVPVVGIVGGMVGAFWGYLAVKIKRPVLGTTAMIVGILVGAMGQSLLAWWAFGQWDLNRCRQQITTLATSLRTYRERTGHFPPKLTDMSGLKLPAPAECPGQGGAYFYLAPSSILPPGDLPAGRQVHGGPASAPGEDGKLLVAEVIQGHRRFRMCITADLVVRALGQNRFAQLMAEPQNASFARKFYPLWAATTKPAKKPAGKPAPPAPTTKAAASRPTTTATAPASIPAVEAEPAK